MDCEILEVTEPGRGLIPPRLPARERVAAQLERLLDTILAPDPDPNSEPSR